THVTREGILSEKHIPSRFKGKRTPVRMIDSEDEAIRLLLDAADAGGCACWVRNTVSDAMEAFDRLSQERPCLLFHARFTAGDRRGIEDQIKRFFGPESTVEERDGRIVVATQVVEQSLDIDFDLMITDLAPIDLIIQRAGRLNRHKRDNRPVKPLLAILSPKPTEDASEDWYSSMFPRGSFVYSVHGELWLTARILEGRDHFLMPEDARELIESVYEVDNADQIPEKIAIRDIRDREERKSRAARAMMNAIVPEDGYVFGQMKWGDDRLLPTRLGDPSVTVRLLRKVGTTLQPWLDIGGDAWWTGEVNVRQYHFSNNILKDSKTGIVEIPMHQESEGLWTGELPGRNENVVRVSYSKVRGISYEG
ncbi:CRISPR-associated helicase Cas3', partial [Methanocalculus sp.]|uniref:CRISPR-associated helicase Cas3' n=1 Tax=Methanocalculus sp. TaxID=2004547 RepID=UPI002715E51A